MISGGTWVDLVFVLGFVLGFVLIGCGIGFLRLVCFVFESCLFCFCGWVLGLSLFWFDF